MLHVNNDQIHPLDGQPHGNYIELSELELTIGIGHEVVTVRYSGDYPGLNGPWIVSPQDCSGGYTSHSTRDGALQQALITLSYLLHPYETPPEGRAAKLACFIRDSL